MPLFTLSQTSAVTDEREARMLSAVDNFGATSSKPDQLAFLRMAAEDDRFRAELEQNPVEALGRFGFQFDSNNLPEKVTLPTKEVLETTLEARQKLDVWSGFPIVEASDNGPMVDVWSGFIGD